MFKVGQRVNRLQDKGIIGSVILEIVQVNEEFVYHIQYDEGVLEGNDGTGWWPENCLSAE